MRAMTPGEQWIDDAEAFDALLGRIRQAPRIGLDTEFHGERSYVPKLMLLQVAIDEEIFLVDPLAELDIKALCETLHDSDTLVVGHALESDLKLFAMRKMPLPARIFDTQVGAAFCGCGPSMGLGPLCERLLGVQLEKSQRFTDWSVRPLGEAQMHYAADDVRYLFRLHDDLDAQLTAAGRGHWVEGETAQLLDAERYQLDPLEAWRKVKGGGALRGRARGILREVAAERVRIAKEIDQPIPFILPDDAVVDFSRRPPRDARDVARHRRVKGRIAKIAGERFALAAKRGAQAEPEQEPPRAVPLDPDAQDVATLLGLVVSAVGRAERVPASVLLPRRGLEAIVRARPDNVDALCAAASLEGWRAELLGPALFEVYDGRKVLRADKAAGVIFE